MKQHPWVIETRATLAWCMRQARGQPHHPDWKGGIYSSLVTWWKFSELFLGRTRLCDTQRRFWIEKQEAGTRWEEIQNLRLEIIQVNTVS